MKKKSLVVLLVLCLALTACELGGSVKYTNLDEMNAAAGTNIKPLGEDETDEKFEVVKKNIAQYTFKIGDEEWCVRASKDVDHDISGYKHDSIKFEKDTQSTYYVDEVYMTRFFKDDVQYTISVKVAGKDISMSYFDHLSSQIQTNITGVKAGYENEITKEDNKVIYKSVVHNNDGTSTIMEIIYVFENDKMVSILNKYTFETEAAARAYYNLLLENGYSADQFEFNANVIQSENNGNVDFYSDYTLEEFFNMMKSSMSL